MGWDTNSSTTGSAFDLDASVFMLDQNKKLVSDQHLVFYNNLKSPDEAVEHTGDNLTGDGDGDDEAVEWGILAIAHEKEHAVQSATLCPWSGRMVYICGDEDMDEQDSSIHVLDFSWEVGR